MGKGQLIVYNMRYVRLCTLTDNSGVSAYSIHEGFSLNEVTELTFKFPVRYSVVSAEVYDSLKAFNGDSSARCHNPDELEALNQYLDSILL